MDTKEAYLSVHEKTSSSSKFTQTIISKKQQSFKCNSETTMEFNPRHVHKMAGLVVKYSEDNKFYLRVAYNKFYKKRSLGILCFENGEFTMPLGKNEILIDDSACKLVLKVKSFYDKLLFSYSFDGREFNIIDIVFDVRITSDKLYNPIGFIETFIGIAFNDSRKKN